MENDHINILAFDIRNSALLAELKTLLTRSQFIEDHNLSRVRDKLIFMLPEAAESKRKQDEIMTKEEKIHNANTVDCMDCGQQISNVNLVTINSLNGVSHRVLCSICSKRLEEMLLNQEIEEIVDFMTL